METKRDENEIMVDEATKLLAEVMLGSGSLTPNQALRAQDFISRSCRRRGDTARYVRQLKAA